MSKTQEHRPAWFRVYLTGANLIQALSDVQVGMAFKATLRYFMDRSYVPTDLDPLADAVFRDLCRGVDEAYQRYETAVESGKKGAELRWNRQEDDAILRKMQDHALSRLHR